MIETKPKGRKALRKALFYQREKSTLRREAELGESIPDKRNSMQNCTLIEEIFEKLKGQSN